MQNPNLPFTWRPALDGLRGIAVVSVTLFHFNGAMLPGGWVGVDLFFALSGFLITSLLLEEWLASGSISIRRFYARRLLRLFPALCVFIVLVAAFRIAFRDASFTGYPTVPDTLENAVFGFAYVYNWGLVFHLLDPTSFGHLWSLAVEEQYYLVWPALLALLLRLRLSPRQLILSTAVLAVISASVPLLLADAPWRRLYYGSDYRVHGLLIGSIAGMLFAFGIVRRKHVGHPGFIAALIAAVAYIALLMLFSSTKRAFLFFDMGLPVLAVCGALIVTACAFIDGGVSAHVLGNRVLTYLGSRSYAIYLWHLPIGQWLRGFDAPEQLLVAGAFTLAAAEVSHRLVERPALSLKKRFSGVPAPSPAPADGVSLELIESPASHVAA